MPPLLLGRWENEKRTCIQDEAPQRPAGVRASRSITGDQQVQGISTPGLRSVLYVSGTDALFECLLSKASFSSLPKVSPLSFIFAWLFYMFFSMCWVSGDTGNGYARGIPESSVPRCRLQAETSRGSPDVTQLASSHHYPQNPGFSQAPPFPVTPMLF